MIDPSFPSFSRRDFLKFSALGMLGLFLDEVGLGRTLSLPPAAQGRTIISGVQLYEAPSFNSRQLDLIGQDQVVEIESVVQGDFGLLNPYNDVWYSVKGQGYAHSAWIQPVETHYQKPVFSIPETGQLGEITVPFTDSRQSPYVWARKGYRVYYSTTHWVTGVSVNRSEKSIWYKIYDNYLQASLYIRSSDMRLVPDAELALLSPELEETRKYIYVDLDTQSLTAFENDQPVMFARCSTGRDGTQTPRGEFLTFHKGSSVHMAGDSAAGAGYDLPGVPWVSFFTGTGIAFHGTYWHNNYGRPLSRGCVNLSPIDAKFIYRWTRPVVPPEVQYLYKPGEGTRVQVFSSQP